MRGERVGNGSDDRRRDGGLQSRKVLPQTQEDGRVVVIARTRHARHDAGSVRSVDQIAQCETGDVVLVVLLVFVVLVTVVVVNQSLRCSFVQVDFAFEVVEKGGGADEKLLEELSQVFI